MPNNDKMFISLLTVLLIVVGAIIMEDFYFSAKFRGSSRPKKGTRPRKPHVDHKKVENRIKNRTVRTNLNDQNCTQNEKTPSRSLFIASPHSSQPVKPAALIKDLAISRNTI